MAFDMSEKTYKTPIQKAMDIMFKPTSFIIMVLVCVIMTLLVQFSALNHQVEKLSKNVDNEFHTEEKLMQKAYSLSSEVKYLEYKEHKLDKKEQKLDDKEKELERGPSEHDKYAHIKEEQHHHSSSDAENLKNFRDLSPE